MIEQEFQEELEEACRIAIEQYGYRPKIFLRMMARHGARGAAKRLLSGNQWQEGFSRMWELNRLDLTVEAHVVKLKYQELFETEDIAEARRRLAECGYNFNE